MKEVFHSGLSMPSFYYSNSGLRVEREGWRKVAREGGEGKGGNMRKEKGRNWPLAVPNMGSSGVSRC